MPETDSIPAASFAALSGSATEHLLLALLWFWHEEFACAWNEVCCENGFWVEMFGPPKKRFEGTGCHAVA